MELHPDTRTRPLQWWPNPWVMLTLQRDTLDTPQLQSDMPDWATLALLDQLSGTPAWDMLVSRLSPPQLATQDTLGMGT